MEYMFYSHVLNKAHGFKVYSHCSPPKVTAPAKLYSYSLVLLDYS